MNAAWADSSPRWMASAVARSWVKVTSARRRSVRARRAIRRRPSSTSVGHLVPVGSVGDDLLDDEPELGATSAARAAASRSSNHSSVRNPPRPATLPIVGRAQPIARPTD